MVLHSQRFMISWKKDKVEKFMKSVSNESGNIKQYKGSCGKSESGGNFVWLISLTEGMTRPYNRRHFEGES